MQLELLLVPSISIIRAAMIRLMFRTYAALLCVVVTLPTSVAAHPPYFSETTGEVTLLGGERGTVRLLYGDGILGHDPVRPVVIDMNDGVRAIAPAGYVASFSCRAQSCRVYVYRDTILLPDVFDTDVESMKTLAVFRAGNEDDLDRILNAKEPYYGFRPVTGIGARLIGALTCLMHWWRSFIFLSLLGSAAIPIWILIRATLDPEEKERWGNLTLAALLSFAIGPFVLLIFFGFLFIAAYPPLLSLIPLGLPTAVWVILAGRRLMVRRA